MSRTEPRTIRAVRELQDWSDEVRRAGRRVALVPTMGALHEGHLSLVRLAHEHAERIVVSIFINPAQFGPGEDLATYPRDMAGDMARLSALGVDVVFTPTTEEMYPPGVPPTWVEVEGLTRGLCGRSRPGHFRGVTSVVARLFNAARPHVAIFGQKDYQQLLVVRAMSQALHLGVEIVAAPTVREPDGLAMSSRNAYLEPAARQQASSLNAALHEARQLFHEGARDARALVAAARRRIAKEPLAEIQYLELCDADTLEPLEKIQARAVMALAVTIDGTRLIDNVLLEMD
ncbi:MAG: pantoate--beta-alanine ligase [Myxococcota bacterium]